MMALDIPDSIFDIYFENADAMIDKWFGVKCTLTYPTVSFYCYNCYFNNTIGKSSNIYKQDGPIPFESGTTCPYCAGEGKILEAGTEDIKLKVYFEKKYWIKMPVQLKVPDGAVQAYGHLEDLPKLQRADKIIINPDIAPFNTYVYRLAGEPALHGFKKNKYFLAMLERNNG